MVRFWSKLLTSCSGTLTLKFLNLSLKIPWIFNWENRTHPVSRYSVIFAPFCCGEKWWRSCIFPNEARSWSASVLPVDYCSVHCTVQRNIHNCAWKIVSALKDRRTKTAQDRSVELRKPVLDSVNFSPFFMGKLVFLFHFLDHISKPNFVREQNDFAIATDWYFDVDRPQSSEHVKNFLRSRCATRWPAPRPRVSSPPFLTAKKTDITLNSVTVHL